MKTKTFRTILIGALVLLLTGSLLAYTGQVAVRALPNGFYVAAAFGTGNLEFDLNGDSIVDMHDIAIAARQMTAAYAQSGPLDPLEAWGESTLILWQYNSTHYAFRNMSTLLVEDVSTNVTSLMWNAVSNLTAGGLLYLKQVQWNQSLPAFSDNALVIEQYDGQIKYYSNQAKFVIPQLATDPNTTGWTTAEQGRMWFNTAEGRIKYWSGTEILVLPGMSGSPPGGTYHLDWQYLVYYYSGDAKYYAEKYDGSILTSNAAAHTVINAAVAALTASRTWIETVVCKGNFTLTAHINAANYTRLSCYGARFTLDASITDSDCIYYAPSGTWTLTHFEVYGGIWDGNKAAQAGADRSCGVEINGNAGDVATHLVFRDMEILNMYQDNTEDTWAEGHGIFFYNAGLTVTDVLIENCYIHDCGTFGYNTNGNGIYLVAVTSNCTFSQNTVVNCPGGIYLYARAYYCHIIDNHLNYIDRDGISLYAQVSDGGVDWNVVSGNTLIDWAIDGAHDGVKVGHHDNVYGAHGNIISDNIFRGLTTSVWRYGINFYGNASYNLAEGNVFDGYMDSCIVSKGDYNLITNNYCMNNIKASAPAMQILSGASNTTIINNYFINIQSATEIVNGGSNTVIQNNYLDEGGWTP